MASLYLLPASVSPRNGAGCTQWSRRPGHASWVPVHGAGPRRRHRGETGDPTQLAAAGTAEGVPAVDSRPGAASMSSALRSLRACSDPATPSGDNCPSGPQHARIPGVFIISSSSCSSRRSGSARSGCAPMAHQPGFRETPERSGAPAAWWRQTGLVLSPSRGHSDSGGAGRGRARSVGLPGLVWGVLRGPIRAGPPPPRGTTWHSLL